MLSAPVSQTRPQARREEAKKYLTFLLNQQEYGLELLRVREIRGLTAITPIPNMPPHIKGVMNLRGAVLPVVDLRLKFKMPAREYDKFTVIIIANAGGKNVGLVVDSVSDVLNVTLEQVHPPPDLGQALESYFVEGLLKISGRLAILLDLDRLLTDSEICADAPTEKALS